MNTFTRTEFLTQAFYQAQSSKGYLDVAQFNSVAIAAASATNIVNNHATDGSVVTPAAQPDVARTLQYVGDAGSTGSQTVTGKDIRGNVLSETVTLNGATVVHGTKAFASINPITLPNQSTKHVSIGFDVAIGLGRLQAFAAPLFATVDGVADSALPTITKHTTDISQNTATFATAPNGSHKYVLGYVTTDLYAGL